MILEDHLGRERLIRPQACSETSDPYLCPLTSILTHLESLIITDEQELQNVCSHKFIQNATITNADKESSHGQELQ